MQHFSRGIDVQFVLEHLKKTLNEVKQYIESFDYKLLSTEYKNNREKLELQCSEGHKFETSYNNFLHSKARCPKCYTHNKLLYSNIKNYIESQNYKLLSKIYYNSNLKLKLQCPEGHIYDVKYHSFKNGRRCPVCSENKGWSKPEKEIFEYIKSIYSGEILENDRTQVKNYWSGYNLELDIFLPELSKAIEYNGIYWHNKNNDVKWKDEIKKKQCIKKDIDLLVITENHWLSNKLNCLNKINDFILV